MIKYLITGFSGFVAFHFLQYLDQTVKLDTVVLGIDKCSPLDFNSNAYKFNFLKVEFQQIDLLDSIQLDSVIGSFYPDRIIHLASLSSVSESWSNPVECFLNNTNIFLNLVEAIKKHNIECRILSIGSSEEYGDVDKSRIPLSEDMELLPINPYAIARVSQELLSRYYVNSLGLDIILTRSFNHIGIRQRDVFFIPSLIKQLLQGKKEGKSTVELFVGDVSVIRDFIDVRDVVRAYYLLLEKGKTGEVYNVCFGKGESLKDIIYEIADLIDIDVKIIVDKNKVRPKDNHIVIGTNKKIRTDIGWKPEITLKETFMDIIKYMKEKI